MTRSVYSGIVLSARVVSCKYRILNKATISQSLQGLAKRQTTPLLPSQERAVKKETVFPSFYEKIQKIENDELLQNHGSTVDDSLLVATGSIDALLLYSSTAPLVDKVDVARHVLAKRSTALIESIVQGDYVDGSFRKAIEAFGAVERDALYVLTIDYVLGRRYAPLVGKPFIGSTVDDSSTAPLVARSTVDCSTGSNSREGLARE